jgi:hyperosmotically inducible protein
MKVSVRLRLALFLAAVPVALSALPTIDLRIEEAARNSYNFRSVLENRVTARAHDGHVTLSGTVADVGDRALAAATVENLPDVTGVTNDIFIKERYTEHSDSWMAVKIRSRLLVKASVSATTTTVRVQDGVAILGGTATTLAQKELTGIYAAEIESVKSVRNEIVVKEGPAPEEKIDDASITTQVQLALLSHESTRALTPKVVTTAGVVRVTGEASSDAEKSLVTKLAQDVRGTTSVTNDMAVKG